MGHKKLIGAFFVTALVVLAYAVQTSADQQVKSRVSSVTIYQDRALITRSATVSLTPGTNTVAFSNLPVGLVDQSIRVSGDVESAVKILDVQVKTVYSDTIPDSRIKTLQDRLSSLKSQEEVLTEKIGVLKTEMSFIDSLRVYYARTAGSATSKTPYQDWETALRFVEKNMDTVNSKSLDANSRLKEVRDKIALVEDEIRRTQSYPRKTEKVVTITLSSDNTGRADLHLSYMLFAAGWSPLYEERVTSGAKTMEFVYSGVVRQSTGEDWKDVAVTLSTAQPSAGGVPPDLAPWHVSIYEPPRPMVDMAKKTIAGESRASEQTIATQTQLSKITSPISTPDAQVVQAAASATFVISAPADIPGDNAPHKVTIATASLPATLSYMCVPKLSDGVYLTAKTENSTDYPFLPGPANIFLDNSFVSMSSVGSVSPGQEFSAYLGTDRSVEIKRRLINRFQEFTGLLSKKTKITYSFLITVDNRKKVPIDIVVKDQVPVSTDERVAVEVKEPDPKVIKQDEQGFLEWHLNLKPAEKKELNLKFSIEYPSDMQVSGI